MSQSEHDQAIADMYEIIISSGRLITIARPNETEAQTDDVMGKVESTATEISINVPVEFVAIPPEEIIQEGHDWKANVIPATNVLEKDFIIDQAIPNTRYRVTNIVKHDLFGAVTHFELQLERTYEENPLI